MQLGKADRGKLRLRRQFNRIRFPYFWVEDVAGIYTVGAAGLCDAGPTAPWLFPSFRRLPVALLEFFVPATEHARLVSDNDTLTLLMVCLKLFSPDQAAHRAARSVHAFAPLASPTRSPRAPSLACFSAPSLEPNTPIEIATIWRLTDWNTYVYFAFAAQARKC